MEINQKHDHLNLNLDNNTSGPIADKYGRKKVAQERNYIPDICHESHENSRVNFFWQWQFTVYFAVITQKIGNLLCILS